MAQGKTIKEHYVPRTYLRSFANENDQCRVFDKEQKKFFISSVENILAERYLYDFDKNFMNFFGNIDEQLIEKTLGMTVDGYWNNIVENISQNYEWFSLKYSYHYLDVYRCAAIQLIRTPQGKKQLFDIYCEICKKDLDAKTENIFLAYAILSILKDISDDSLLRLLLEKYGHVSIGINDTEIPFVTSDNPIITLADFWDEEYSDTMMYYPITPNRCLFFHRRKKIDHQLNAVLEDWLNGRFQITNIYDILQEAYRREKALNEKKNPLTRQVSDAEVIVLNTCLYKTAIRFVIAGADIKGEEGLWLQKDKNTERENQYE